MQCNNTSVIETQIDYDELEMSVLHKISRVVVERKNVSELISETLEILNTQMGFLRGTITLRDGDFLFIEASNGIDEASIKRGVYKIGEGIVGRVALFGESIIIEDISEDENFLNKTKTRGDSLKGISYICVPIIYIDQVIGTLSLDRKSNPSVSLKRDLILIETVANILADAVALIYLRYEERNKLLEENRRLKLELSSTYIRPSVILGNCGAMQNIYESMARFSTHKQPILVRGDSGTGKDVVAKEIALQTDDFNSSLDIVHCSTLSHDNMILEFLGDGGSQLGLFYKKTNLFLNEISEMPLSVQEIIVEVLENSDSDIKARLIFASSADLEKLVELNQFDRHLYTILSKNTLHIPALRDRKSDILLLAEHFLEKYNKIHNKNIKRISTPAITMMTAYHWPDNVRELENCIERAVISSNDSAISGYNLTPAVRANYMNNNTSYDEDIDFESMVLSFERELIIEALKANKGKAAPAARQLGLSERIINYKIKQYAITTAWYKNSK